MRSFLFLLALLGFLVCLLAVTPGCEEQTPIEAFDKSLIPTDSLPSVREHATYHNAEVDRLLLLNQSSQGLPYESLLKEMGRRTPAMAAPDEWIARSRTLLSTLLSLPLDKQLTQQIHNIAMHCLSDFQTNSDTDPQVNSTIKEALEVLKTGNPELLKIKLTNLAALAENQGNQAQKSVAGVFLGSFERQAPSQEPASREPWYWPIIIYYDVIGSLSGGSSVGSYFSFMAEYFFSSFPWFG